MSFKISEKMAGVRNIATISVRILYYTHFLKKIELGLCNFFIIYPRKTGEGAFFEYLSPFCFLSIEVHCTFSISYKILPYFVYYYCILVRM